VNRTSLNMLSRRSSPQLIITTVVLRSIRLTRHAHFFMRVPIFSSGFTRVSLVFKSTGWTKTSHFSSHQIRSDSPFQRAWLSFCYSCCLLRSWQIHWSQTTLRRVQSPPSLILPEVSDISGIQQRSFKLSSITMGMVLSMLGES
jgi:hypothetical protein